MHIVQRFRKQKFMLVLLLAFVLLLGLTAATHAAPEQQTGGVYHTIRWGETLSGIARYYGTTTQAIMAANPQIWNPNLIFAGTVLFIPSGYVPPAPPPPPPPTYCRYYHTVQYGDNLNRISAWYGTNPWSIAQANRIYNLNLIYAGQVLCIP